MKKTIILSLIVALISVGILLFYNKKEIYIDAVLTSKNYSYLPSEAKEYVKEIYKNTGEVILTEKNKKENKLYLNPEYVDFLTQSDENKKGEIPFSLIVDYSKSIKSRNNNLPSQYDLRNVNNNNYVTPVRDQGNLGICWTFATAGAAESYLLKKNNTPYNSSSTLISERQIDYATSRNGINDYKSEYVSFINRSLGDGGNFYISTIAIASGISLFDYNSFKEYDDSDLSKMELSDVLSYDKSLYNVESTINFPRMDLRDSTSILTDEEKEIRTSFLNNVKQKIIDKGAAYVSTYMDSSCRYIDSSLDNTVIDVFNCHQFGGHAMQIIGWDDDLEYSYCADTKNHKSDISNCNRIVKGKGVWILKNSWGDSNPNPYLTYDSLSTSIHFINELEEEKNWDSNYILGDGYEITTDKYYNLSDTRIKDEEKLEKIKFISETPNTEYNVKVYKADETYETFTQTIELPGLITFDIDKNITVNKNTKIEIEGEDGFVDKIMVFTSNIESAPYINLDEYNNKAIYENKLRLYSETKNIPSGEIITYKVYNSNNQDISANISISNNIIAENNINTLIDFSNVLNSGTYKIEAIYNSQVISSINVNIVKMEGDGTEDNPYIITNPTQLYQIRNDLDGYYELGNDIDLSEDTKEGGKLSLKSDACPQGFGWEAINGFNGSLDGKGHTIKGLYQKNYITCNEEEAPISEWTNNGNGLFGTTSGDITIKNLILEDFDVKCYGSDCGLLVSKYKNLDQEEKTATFKNIAVKNSKSGAVTYRGNSIGGGLFNDFLSSSGNITISNIYIDINIDTEYLMKSAYLVGYLQGHNVNVENVRLMGNLKGKDETGVLNYSLFAYDPTNIKNIISTATATNLKNSLLGYVNGDNLTLNNINILNISDQPVCKNNSTSCTAATNVNIYDKDTQLSELTKRSNYNTWTNFDSDWILRTIDGIPRIPVLKFMDFEYTSIPDITINQKINEKKNLYDYITPKIDAAKNISFKSNDENIVKLNEDGTIIPQSTGETTIHVESLYDGYIKDVPISINYVPHYNIIFDANGGEGSMDSVEVNASENYTLPSNSFTKENYEFKEWNTKSDGTGDSYPDLGQVSGLSDKEELKLYAQWIGEERIVTLDPSGGTVNPDKITVRYGGTYGELPMPTREGYAFQGWSSGGMLVGSSTKIYGYTLTAIWQNDAYNIIYNGNGGTLRENSGISNYYILSNSKVIATSSYNSEVNTSNNIYIKEGYTFKEWNTKPDGTGTSYSENAAINQEDIEENLLTLYAIWDENPSYMKGDINYDERVTLLDIRIILQKILNNDYNDSEKWIIDYNEDEEASLLDIRAILQYILNN